MGVYCAQLKLKALSKGPLEVHPAHPPSRQGGATENKDRKIKYLSETFLFSPVDQIHVKIKETLGDLLRARKKACPGKLLSGLLK